ncbi:MAG TPA: HNH endonuclease signature motif containing protein [Gryllotalpicola sp.]
MIGPKTPKLSPQDARRAYQLATKRDAGRCVRCGRTDVTRDHRQNRTAHNTTAGNLQLLCGTGTTGCHGWKTGHPADAIAEGFAVPGWVPNPAAWPAARWGHDPATNVYHRRFVLYDDTGGITTITPAEADQLSDGLITLD